MWLGKRSFKESLSIPRFQCPTYRILRPRFRSSADSSVVWTVNTDWLHSCSELYVPGRNDRWWTDGWSGETPLSPGARPSPPAPRQTWPLPGEDANPSPRWLLKSAGVVTSLCSVDYSSDKQTTRHPGLCQTSGGGRGVGGRGCWASPRGVPQKWPPRPVNKHRQNNDRYKPRN